VDVSGRRAATVGYGIIMQIARLGQSRSMARVQSLVCAAMWQNRLAVAIIPEIGNNSTTDAMAMDCTTRTELEAAAFRRLLEHLRSRSDVQNIDLMNLAGFCRNCLSNWLKDAADEKGTPMTKDESREAVYGMPYEEWKAKHQREASPAQVEALKKSHPGH
jgi:uncharacterized protein